MPKLKLLKRVFIQHALRLSARRAFLVVYNLAFSTPVFSYTRTRARVRPGRASLVLFGVVLLAAFSFASFATLAGPERADATTANTVNFQARLMTAGGAIVPDGTYNVEFKLYNAATSTGTPNQGACTMTPGTTADPSCLWVETRTGANTVSVANGYLTVNLGSVTNFPASMNWGQQLWLSMRIGGTGAPSWDTEMSPRLLLTAVPAAYSLTQYNSANTFSSSLALQAPTGGNQTFVIQDQTAAGTYNLCIQNSTACGFAPASSSGSYIQNQNASAQSTSVFWISGDGRSTTSFTTPLLQSAAGTALDVEAGTTGNLTLGTSASNKTINIGNVTNGNANTTAINIGTSTGAGQTIAIGSSNGSSSVTLTGGASTISVANANTTILGTAVNVNNSGSGTTTIGNTTSGGAVGINTSGANNITLQTNNSSASVLVKSTANSTTAFQVQNASGTPIFLVDTSTTSNLITNPGFEVNTSTGWTYTNATGTQNLTKPNTYHGQASNSVNVTVAGGGANVTSFTGSITPAQYTFSFYAMKGTNGGTLSVAITGGSAPTCTLVNYVAPVTTGFQRYTCTFTSTSTNVTQISINSSATGTFYLDAVELNTGATAAPYGAQGTVQIRGTVNSPLTLQNTADSTTAFQIQNASGTSNLFVADTLNGQVNIGGNNITPLVVSGSNTTNIISIVPGTGAIGNQAYFSANSRARFGYNGSSVVIDTNGANKPISLWTGPSGNDQQRLTIDTSGGVTINGLSTAGIVTNTAAGLLGTTNNLAVNLGGTGNTSYTIGDLLYASGATTLSKLAAVASGSCLISQGTSTAPVWGGCTTLTATNGLNIASNQVGLGGTLSNSTTTLTSGGTSSQLQLSSGTNIPATDQLAITNTGSTGVATAGVNGLSVNYKGGAAAVEAGAFRIDLQPGTTSGGTWNGARIVPNATGAVAGVTENGIKLDNLTTPGAGTENALFVGTGWDNVLQATNVTITQAGAITAVGVNSGTGLLQGTGGLTATGTVQLNTSGTAATTIGSTAATTTSIQGGTAINIGTGGAANTIQIGNTTGAVTQTINIGNNGAGSSTTNVIIGSAVGGTTTLQSIGGVVLGAVGATNTSNIICRNTTNVLSSCNTLSVGQGGTGTISFTSNGILYGNGAGAILATAAGTTGQCLIATTGAAPSWSGCPATETLQTAYNVGVGGTTPSIAVSTTKGALSIQDSATNTITGNLLEVRSAAVNDSTLGTVQFSVTNAGVVQGNSYKIGANTVLSLPGGTTNLAVGPSAGSLISGDNDNTVVGYNAGAAITSGFNDTAVGALALQNATGGENTAIGVQAGGTITTGTKNTFVGEFADATVNNLTNATAIGAYAQVSASNSIVLGGTGANAVKVGIGTTAPTATLTVQGVAANDLASYGAEMFSASESFPATAGWTSISGTGSAATATHTNGGGVTALPASPALTITAGTYYRIRFNVTGMTQGNVYASIGGNSTTTVYDNVNNFYQVIQATNTSNLTFTPTTTFNGTITNVSVTAVTTAVQTLQVNNSNSTTALEVRSGGNSMQSTFVGYQAGLASSGGGNNTALGYWALQTQTTGAGNTAVGTQALQYATTGNNNTALGFQALQNGGISSGNTAVGTGALQYTNVGNFNTAVGQQSGNNITSGANNALLGYNSGFGLSTGSNNVLLGYQAGNNLTTGGNNIIIGASITAASATASNQINIGNVLTGSTSGGPLTLQSASNQNLTVQAQGSGNVNILTNNASASVIVKSQANSTNAFQVQNAAGTSLLTADTVNTKIVVNGDVNVGTVFGSRLFSDNFESGNFSLWNRTASIGSGSTYTADTTQPHNGKYAAKVVTTGNVSLESTSVKASSTIYAHAYVYISSHTAGNLDLMDFTPSAAPSTGVTLYRDFATGRLWLWNNTASIGNDTGQSLPLSSWHYVEMQITTGNPGTIQVWLDGTRYLNITTQNLGTNPIDIFDLGESSSGRTGTAYYDDVSVDSGIATSTPAASLDVQDSLHVGGTATFGNEVLVQPGSNTTTAFQIQNNTGTSLFLADTLNGRIGIGTSSPTHTLEVASSVSGVSVASFSCANSTSFCQNALGNGTVTVDWGVTSSLGYMGTNSAHDLALRTGAATRIFVQNSTGNVGIGTSSPGALLSIANGANDATNYGRALQITNLSGNSQQIAFIRNGNNVVSAGYKGASSVWGFGSGQVTDSSFDPSYLSMDLANNRIGIGTSAPTAQLANTNANPLDVFGNGVSGGALNFRNASGTSGYVAEFTNTYASTVGNGVLIQGADTSSSSRLLEVESGSTSRFLVRSDGNVGIGNSSPAYALDVGGNIQGTNFIYLKSSAGTPTYGTSYLTVSSDGNYNTTLFGTTGGGSDFYKIQGAGSANAGELDIQTGDDGTEPIVFQQNGGGTVYERMRIDSSGNVNVNNVLSVGSYINGSSFIRAAGELQSTSANAVRMVQGNYGSFWRNDGSTTYLLLTASADQYGSWNSLRPFQVDNASGSVGIGNNTLTVVQGGTTTVNNGLQVNGGATVSGGLTVSSSGASITGTTSINSSGAGLVVLSTSSIGEVIDFGRSGTEARLAIAATAGNWISGTAAGDVALRTDNSSASVWIGAGGSSGNGAIRVSNGGLLIRGSSGTCTFTGTAGSTCASDARLKTNVQSISDQDSLNGILGLRAVTYNWIDQSLDQSTQYGFIAQEVQQSLPQFVNQMDNGYLGVNYGALIIPAIGAIQQEQKEITGINNQLDSFGAILNNGDIKANSLDVMSSAHFAADINVDGNLTVKGMTTVTDITVNGHIITAGDAPGIQILPAAGSSNASVSVDGNDTSGTITIVSGDASAPAHDGVAAITGPAAGDMATISFRKPYGKMPRILITPADGKSAPMLVYPTSMSANGFTISLSGTPVANTTYTFTYFIVQ